MLFVVKGLLPMNITEVHLVARDGITM
jgi:hypothetical protein